MQATRCIYLGVASGISTRDFLRCGLLEALAGHHIVIVTPLAALPEFVQEFERSDVTILPAPVGEARLDQAVLGKSRRWVRRHMPATNGMWRAIAKLMLSMEPYRTYFKRIPPDVVVIPTPRKEHPSDIHLALVAQAEGVRSVCVVSSWDNPPKGPFRVHTDRVAVWNALNARTMTAAHGYRASEVTVTGAMQFDPYFRNPPLQTREEFCDRLGLDPARPLILVATSGPFIRDQSFIVDDLLQAIGAGAIEPPPQIIVRVHFADKVEFFACFESSPGVHLDYSRRWYRMLGIYGWTMTLDDIHYMANLLHHSDVVISMASTVTVEAAIFDTPAIVVAYSPYEPERVQAVLDRFAFRQHFKPLVDQSLVPVVRDRGQLVNWVNQYLSTPTLHQAERQTIVRQIVSFTDGHSSQRVARLILNTAGAL